MYYYVSMSARTSVLGGGAGRQPLTEARPCRPAGTLDQRRADVALCVTRVHMHVVRRGARRSPNGQKLPLVLWIGVGVGLVMFLFGCVRRVVFLLLSSDSDRACVALFVSSSLL